MPTIRHEYPNSNDAIVAAQPRGIILGKVSGPSIPITELTTRAPAPRSAASVAPKPKPKPERGRIPARPPNTARAAALTAGRIRSTSSWTARAIASAAASSHFVEKNR